MRHFYSIYTGVTLDRAALWARQAWRSYFSGARAQWACSAPRWAGRARIWAALAPAAYGTAPGPFGAHQRGWQSDGGARATSSGRLLCAGRMSSVRIQGPSLGRARPRRQWAGRPKPGAILAARARPRSNWAPGAPNNSPRPAAGLCGLCGLTLDA